jgi:hypothetical protein
MFKKGLTNTDWLNLFLCRKSGYKAVTKGKMI